MANDLIQILGFPALHWQNQAIQYDAAPAAVENVSVPS